MTLLFDFFREYMQLYYALYGDVPAILIRAIGGTLIAVNFIGFGVFFLMFSKHTNKGRIPDGLEKKRIFSSRLFGLFLITCGLSRALGVLAIWHNFAIIEGIFTLLTGILSLIALVMLPSFIRGMRRVTAVTDIKQELKKTQEDLETLHKIAKTLDDTSPKQ